MKLFKLSFIISALTLIISLTIVPLNAQASSNSLFAITPYTSLQKLDFFFLNSLHPLYFIETPDTKPVFLSIITNEQKNTYLKNGYQPLIIDENANNLNQYYLVSSVKYGEKQSKLLLDPNLKKNGIEIAYPLTKTTTLIKLAENKSYSSVYLPQRQYFKAIRLNKDFIPPSERTESTSRSTPTPTTTSKEFTQSNSKATLIASILFILVIYLIFSRFKKTKKHPNK